MRKKTKTITRVAFWVTIALLGASWTRFFPYNLIICAIGGGIAGWYTAVIK